MLELRLVRTGESLSQILGPCSLFLNGIALRRRHNSAANGRRTEEYRGNREQAALHRARPFVASTAAFFVTLQSILSFSVRRSYVATAIRGVTRRGTALKRRPRKRRERRRVQPPQSPLSLARQLALPPQQRPPLRRRTPLALPRRHTPLIMGSDSLGRRCYLASQCQRPLAR